MTELELLKSSWLQGGALLALFVGMATIIAVLWRAREAALVRCQALSDAHVADLKLLIPAVRTLEELTPE